MKKVIRLTESDLMRIVKRVINEQEQQQTGESYVSEVLKPYLDKNKPLDAVSLIQNAHLGSTMSTNSNLKDSDIGSSSIPSIISQQVRDFQRMTPKDGKKYSAIRDGIMMRAAKSPKDETSIIFRPFNGGQQVGLYGARYIPSISNSTQFILVSCTQQEPCRATDRLR